MGITGYIVGPYRDNGKEDGNYYKGVVWGLGFEGLGALALGVKDL